MKPWRNVINSRRAEHRGKPAIVNQLECGHEIIIAGSTEALAKARTVERRRCFHCPDEIPQPKKRQSAKRSYILIRDTDF